MLEETNQRMVNSKYENISYSQIMNVHFFFLLLSIKCAAVQLNKSSTQLHRVKGHHLYVYTGDW